jgi:ATP-dependent Clp protease protease subunit
MKPWYRIENKDGGEQAEIYIYGYIVDQKWNEADPDVTPTDFKDELDKLANVKRIDLYVNSGGGNVWAGLAIYHMLARHPAEKIGHVDGIAASIASVILMACDTVLAPRTSMMLVHKALIAGIVVGNSDDFMQIAGELEKVDTVIIEAYAKKTGLKPQKIAEIMAKDTYMTAEEAVDLGFADDYDEETQIQASIRGDKLLINGVRFDMNRFKNFPRERFQASKQPKKAIETELSEHAGETEKPTNQPLSSENSASESGSVPPEPLKPPDFSMEEAQIEINRNSL